MEEYLKVTKEIKSTLPVQSSSGCMCQYKYTNNQDLEKLEPNIKKENKDNISDTDKTKVGNIIIGHAYLSYLILCLHFPSC